MGRKIILQVNGFSGILSFFFFSPYIVTTLGFLYILKRSLGAALEDKHIT